MVTVKELITADRRDTVSAQDNSGEDYGHKVSVVVHDVVGRRCCPCSIR